ncbi:MAG: alkaline phosphatase D family protein [Algiphilus sp.]|uniref:alkaline phosphatase D family protein n=1 Tax=Algiphilus sp. TaxID=1872431 RepID=UPI001CA7534D|nr:alkaline phosphatase D family protein [Algiphilus sp.]MBY8966524.1 alkaline phosphatase D family protein [Algiphilus acroporae]MCI5104366.1 alkaline phosphatase D family protein [Algiphilus sp.]
MSAPRRPRPGHVSRRNFLRRTGYGLPAAALVGCGSSGNSAGQGDAAQIFRHGVASGDPLDDRVIVWTRVTTEQPRAVPVLLEMALDPDFGTVVVSQQSMAAPERDQTVKLDVAGLSSGTTYYYRFSALGATSPVGRTRTAPTGPTERLRLGIVSCSSLAHGFFNAYRLLARRADIDCVLHLGDYIYEYGTGEYGNVRAYEPSTEILTLSDYRQRYSQYRQDPDLSELHRQHPMIAVWDDHETTDNSFRDNAKNHTEQTESDPGEGCWVQRKAWAIQAYREWMPIRDNLADYVAPQSCDDQRDPERIKAQERIWRRFSFGDLVDLHMLDTRLFDRDIARRPNVLTTAGSPAGINSANDVQDNGLFANCAAPYDEDYSNIGDAQLDWLLSGLKESQARWKLVGQQVMFGQLKVLGLPEAGCALPNTGDVVSLLENTAPDSPLSAVLGAVVDQLPTVSASSLYLNGDQWDGYPSGRKAILDTLRDNAIDNTVVLTGDIHTSWAIDISDDPNNPASYNPITGAGAQAVEFVCTSVTSPGLDPLDGVSDVLRLNNPHMKYINLARRGYMVLDVTTERCQGEWYYVETVTEPGVDGESLGAAFFTASGDNHLQEAASASEPPASVPKLAP